MAEVVGASGAWKDIAADIQQRGHTLGKPGDIEPLLAQLRETRQASIDANRAQTLAAVQITAKRIALLSSEPGLIRRFLNRSEVGRLRRSIETIYAMDAGYPALLDATVARLESLPQSAEIAGAEAELAVIEQLRKLSPAHTVFNDVRLRASRHIRFNGAALQSAQLDHVVVSVAGVFVIETKHWSRRFAESGAFHDPYDQVQRASYLCFDLLRQHFGETRVRSVIACVGSLPDAPADSHTKVLHLGDLNGYISQFKREVTFEQMEALRRFFAYHVTA